MRKGLEALMIEGFRNSNIYIEGYKIKKESLKVDKGQISDFGSVSANNLLTLPDNLILIPGLIDEHIHGSDGFDTQDANRESLHAIAQGVLKDGVTAFCPTTMTMSEEEIISALKNINSYIQDKPSDTAIVLGAHLEGPFISAKFKGAQEEKNIRKCDVDLFKRFQKACPFIKEVTFAYEEDGEGLLKYLISQNITPSIGHTNCSSDLLKKGIDEGLRCATHTFNAMSPFHHREIGTVGMVLLDDRVKAELICDLIHVSPNAIRLLYKCKGKSIILITDSMEAKHMKDGFYSLGGQKVIVKDNAARLEDGTLAGSILTLNKAVKNISSVLGISLEEAIDLASLNPAVNLREDKERGSIKKGKRADFAIVDKDMDVKATIVGGEILFRKENYSWLR
jgi:N-acetylglucosamine-6-phosphate deacetylase